MKRLFVAIVLAIALMVWLTGCQPRELPRDDGTALLREISEARVNTAARGTVTTYILAGGKEVNAEAKIHRGAGRMQMEFVSGKAKGSKIYQQGGFVWQVAPDGETVRRLPHNPVDQMPYFGKDAVVTVGPGSRVAGCSTERVVFRPGAKSGARLELLVDRTTKFPLVSERYAKDGTLVARTAFNEVEFDVEPPTKVEPPKAEEGREWLAETTKIDIAQAKEILGEAPVEPGYTPAEMEDTGYYLHERGPLKGVERRYSDGVRLLSVITFRRPERPDGGRSERAPMDRERVSGAGQNWLEQHPQARERWESATPEEREELRERWLARGRALQRENGDAGTGRANRGERRPEGDAEVEQPMRFRDRGPAEGAGRPEGVDRRGSGERRPEGDAEVEQPMRFRDRGPAEGAGRPEGVDRRGSGERRPEGERPARDVLKRRMDEGVRASRVHGRVARLMVGEFVVVVHGDLPADELRKVVDSMKEKATDF